MTNGQGYIEEQICNLRQSLDASFQALSQRVARLEKQQRQPCKEEGPLQLTLQRWEAIELCVYLKSAPFNSYGQIVDQLSKGLGFEPL